MSCVCVCVPTSDTHTTRCSSFTSVHVHEVCPYRIELRIGFDHFASAVLCPLSHSTTYVSPPVAANCANAVEIGARARRGGENCDPHTCFDVRVASTKGIRCYKHAHTHDAYAWHVRSPTISWAHGQHVCVYYMSIHPPTHIHPKNTPTRSIPL